jgi:SOS-response transcriptional repressor LexA
MDAIYRNSVVHVNRISGFISSKVRGMNSASSRLRAAREAAGFETATEAAHRFGWTPSTYASHENGQTPPPAKRALEYARAFRVSAGWILTGEGRGINSTEDIVILQPPSTLVHAAVRGSVKAGAWMEFDDDFTQDAQFVPVIPGEYSKLEQVSYKVLGDSMDKARMFDGDYIICVPYFDARREITNGDTVVVERRRGSTMERTVKIVVRDGQEIRLEPRSTNARHMPIIMPKNDDGKEDETTIEIVGYVIGIYAKVGNA